MTWDLEHLPCVEKLRDLRLFRFEKGRLRGNFITVNKYLKSGRQAMGPGSSQWCPETGKGAVDINQNIESSI